MTRRDTHQSRSQVGKEPLDLSAVAFSRNAEEAKAPGIRTDIVAIARAVEASTGWDVDLSKVRFEGVSAGELVRRYAVDALRRTGVGFVPPASESSRKAFGDMVAARFLEAPAVFLPAEGAILFNEEISSTVTRDSLRSALFHELVHVAQFQSYPDFWSAADTLHREAILMMRHGGDVPRDYREERLKLVQDRMQARKALLEGQAAVLQAEYVRGNDLRTRYGSEVFDVVIGESAFIAVGSSKIVSQFVAGALTVKELQDRNASLIDTLFENPALCEVVFGASNPSLAQKSTKRSDSAQQSAS
jgi:hypothetical protein